MRAILVIEGDALIRELMREHLEYEGYVVCAVASVRIALDAARWTRFGLVLLNFDEALNCSREDLTALRRLGVPVVMMRTAPAGSVVGMEGEIQQVVWSPFDWSTLSCAVRRFLPLAGRRDEGEQEGPHVTRSGTFVATREGGLFQREVATLAEPSEGRSVARVSLGVVGRGRR